MPSMDAVVKVFCVHTEPNFSLLWQRKRQYSSSSSGFIIGGRRVLTNAHSVEHHTQVKFKKRVQIPSTWLLCWLLGLNVILVWENFCVLYFLFFVVDVVELIYCLGLIYPKF